MKQSINTPEGWAAVVRRCKQLQEAGQPVTNDNLLRLRESEDDDQ